MIFLSIVITKLTKYHVTDVLVFCFLYYGLVINELMFHINLLLDSCWVMNKIYANLNIGYTHLEIRISWQLKLLVSHSDPIVSTMILVEDVSEECY